MQPRHVAMAGAAASPDRGGGSLQRQSAQSELRSLLPLLILPSLAQIGVAMLQWRASSGWRRSSDHNPMGVLHASVDRAQREVGVLLDPQGRVEDVTGNVREVMGLRVCDASGAGLSIACTCSTVRSS